MKDITHYTKEQILSGQAILFLGAGASLDAKSEDGNKNGLTGNQLKDKICDKFLGGKGKEKPLSYVGSLAIDAAGMGPVHRYIDELVRDLEPTVGHQLAAKFRWKAIVTTNYDFLVEKTYSNNNENQILKPIIWDRDDIQGCFSEPQNLPYLKVHGCVSRLNDPELPLILSSRDYYKFRKNRESVFGKLKELAFSHPIIFCGYSISDENIRDLIFDVSSPELNRPRYVLVDPSIEEHDRAYWGSNRFDCVKLSFSDFMNALSSQIPDTFSQLTQLISDSPFSIKKFISSNIKPSDRLLKYIDEELLHIYPSMPVEKSLAKRFFKGDSSGFGWITSEFDVKRTIVDTLVEDTVVDSNSSISTKTFLYLIKGYAGSGKSVSLKRFAWDAASEYNAPVFHLKQGGILDVENVIELSELITDRIYVVIDNILEHENEILDLFARAKRTSYPITIIGGARTNEWNMAGEKLEAVVSSNYDLLDLNSKEIKLLLENLTKHSCLGYLSTLPVPEREKYLKEKLKSQLLVALHEATEGRSFEDIVYDEYEHVIPIEAKIAYLDICTLDRFDIGARAGLLSRISGVGFNGFYKELLSPLENVVSAFYDHKSGDYTYRTRHFHIADLVFNRALHDAEEKSQQIIKIIRYLNSSYDSDKKAISQLIKGKTLADEFTNKSLVDNIFDIALESGIEESVVLHQRAVFELHHPGGDLRKALTYINKAEESDGVVSPKSLAHTKSNIFRRMASASNIPLEKRKLRQDALTILNGVIKNTKDSLPYFTKGQLLFEEMKDRTIDLSLIKDDDIDKQEIQVRVIDELSKKIEDTLQRGLRAFPSDERLLNLEAEVSKFLEDTPRALQALEKAYRNNKDSIYTAIRLSRHYFKYDETRDKALAIIKEITVNHHTNKEAHFELAKMLMSNNGTSSNDEILYYLKRSFSPSDTHYEARFLYARHEFLYGDKEKSIAEFSALSKLNLPPSIMNNIRAEVKDSSDEKRKKIYEGKIVSVHESFAFIQCNNLPSHVFLHFKSMIDENEWGMIKRDVYVKFNLGFTFKGPAANRVSVVYL